jgi:hypothetical protein
VNNQIQPFYTGIQPGTRLFVLVIGIAMLLFVLNQVRRKRLREQYSLLWIFSAAVLVLAAVFIGQVDRLAHAIGIYYPPAALFLVAILVIFALQFHFSTEISSLREQNKTLTQDLGLLESELRELRRSRGPGSTEV